MCQAEKGYPYVDSLPARLLDLRHQEGRRLQERWVLTVLVAPVPCAVHCAIWKDPQEVAPIATVEEFGLLVIPRRQIKLLHQGGEGCDFPFSHGSAATGYGAFKAVRNQTTL